MMTSRVLAALLMAATAASTGWSGPRTQDGRKTSATIAQAGWLAGTWIGTAGPMTLEERWTPPAGGAMLAVSRTIKDGRMVAFEFLRIVEREGALVYVAQPEGRPPTEFALSKMDASSLTFENPAHDFPKVIRYEKRPDGTLEARISGEAQQRAQTFRFKRQEP